MPEDHDVDVHAEEAHEVEVIDLDAADDTGDYEVIETIDVELIQQDLAEARLQRQYTRGQLDGAISAAKFGFALLAMYWIAQLLTNVLA